MSYLAIPLITAACFFAAAFDAWMRVAQGSVLAAIPLAVLWVALLVMLLWEGNVESRALGVGVVTLLTAGVLARWFATTFQWSPSVTRVALVEVVMFALGVMNIIAGRRRRARETRIAV